MKPAHKGAAYSTPCGIEMSHPAIQQARRFLDQMYLGGAVLAAICLLAIAALILAQIAGRWFGIIVPAAEEFAGFLMAAATFLALAWTLRDGGHIRVTLLIRNISPRFRRLQEVLVLLLAVALGACLSVAAIALVLESYEFHDVSAGYIAVPLWIPQLPMALGLVLFTIALLEELLSLLAGHSPSYTDDEGDTI